MADYTKLLKSPLEALRRQRAYHSSPYDFEKFRLGKVGGMEGYNDQGHGLYFAEDPNNARGYREYFKENGYKDPKTYEVDLHAPRESFLSDNFRLDEQPIGERLMELLTPQFSDLSSKMTGQELYSALDEILGSAPKASSHLRKTGVPGIRYFDHGASKPLSGTEDFVVFDPKIIEILKKYSQGGKIHV